MASSTSICWRCHSLHLRAFRTSKRWTNPYGTRHPFSTSPLRLRSSSDPTSSLFPIFQPSFWRSILPKRSRLRPETSRSGPARPHWIRDPATHIIVLSLLAGSQAIQILALKREHLNYSLRTDAYIAKLREVIGRVQRGEDVDVKKELGTGDEKREREWEEVMREIAKEDEVFVSRRRAAREGNVEREERGSGDTSSQGAIEDYTVEEGNRAQYQTTSDAGESASSQTASVSGNPGSQVRYY